MSKNHKMLRLLATTSIIATNVFPVTPQLPQIVVQAASLQEEQEPSATEESSTRTETGRSKEETSTSQSVESADVSQDQDARKQEGKSKDTKSSGTWGTSPYTFDETTGTMTIYAGTLGDHWQQPWSKGEVSPDQIKKIELIGDVVAPADSSCLFSAYMLKNRLFNLNEITGMENLDTSHVTKMYSMFAHCSSLKNLDVSHFNTSNVTDMFAMFYSCSSLTTLDVSSFDTSNVTSMNEMFHSCSNLQSLDLSNFDMSQVTSMNTMFDSCSNLNEITLGEKSFFDDTVNLPDGTWLGKNTGVSYATSADFMNNYDGSQPDTFLKIDNVRYWGTAPYIFDESTGTMTVYGGNLGENGQQPWVKGEVSAEKIQKIDLVGKVVAPEDSRRLFSADAVGNRLSNLKEINGLTNLDTSNVKDMYDLFSGCSSLQSLDLSSFDTSQVTNMMAMFYECSNLQSLDLSSFDTSQVTDMGEMFNKCSSLQSLDLSNFNTKQVTSMYTMFSGCSNLQNINMSSFDTSQVTTMENMFASCSNLQSVDVSNFDTSQVTDMGWMFCECSSLQSLDLSSFDTSNVTVMTDMFLDTSNLKELTLGEKSVFNDTVHLPDGTWLGKNTGVPYATSNDFMVKYDGSQPDTFIRTTGMKYWGTSPYTFDETTGTMTIYSGTLGTYKDSPWNTSTSYIKGDSIQKIELFGKVVAPKESQYLFSSDMLNFLQNLKEISGLEKLDTSQVTNMDAMFAYCSSLQSLDLSHFACILIKWTHFFGILLNK